jgi:hypothetical protein
MKIKKTKNNLDKSSVNDTRIKNAKPYNSITKNMETKRNNNDKISLGNSFTLH